MLLDTMNHEEINREISKDLESVCNSLKRLGAEYDRDRRKKKIDKSLAHPVVYPIKTKVKNNWLIFLSKAPALASYKGMEFINTQFITYYYTAKGLRVFHKGSTGGFVVHNAHFFTRYNERMDLGLLEPIDLVKHFFINNGYSTSKVIQKDGKEYVITTYRDGIGLGELQHGRMWLVNKTFISKDLLRPDQDAIEKDLVESLQKEIEDEISSGNFDKSSYEFKADVIKALQK